MKIFLTLLFLITANRALLQLRLVLPVGHTAEINVVKFSPDGKKVITGSRDNTLKLWDVKSGMLLNELKSSRAISSALFHKNGKNVIISCDSDSIVRIWDINSGKVITELRGHSKEINSVHFSSDGKRVVTSSMDSTAKIWDFETGKLLETLTNRSASVISAIFSENDQQIITSARDTATRVWNVKTKKELTSFNIYSFITSFSKSGYKGISFTESDNGYPMVADKYGNIRIRSRNAGKQPLTLKNGTSIFSSFLRKKQAVITITSEGECKIRNLTTGMKVTSFNVDNTNYNPNSVITVSSDEKKLIYPVWEKIQVYDLLQGKLLFEIKTGISPFSGYDISGDNTRLVVANNNEANIFNISTGQLIKDLAIRNTTSILDPVLFSPNGKMIVTGGGEVKIWDVSKAGLIKSINKKAGYIEFLKDQKMITAEGKGALIPDLKVKDWWYTGTYFWENETTPRISTNIDSAATIWNLNDHTFQEGFKDSIYWIVGAQYSPDKKKLSITSSGSAVKVWDVETKKSLFELSQTVFTGETRSKPLIYGKKGEKIFTVGMDVKMWDGKTGKYLASLGRWFAELSPDSTTLITGGDQGRFNIYDILTGNNRDIKISNAFTFVRSAKFSPDGNLFLTIASNDNVPIVWELNKRQIKFKLVGHTSDIISAAFSPEGREIFTSSLDNTCKMWNATTGKLIYTLIPFGSSDYLFQLPSKYYKSTSDASKLLHYVTPDLRVVAFDQLDVKYNRPDKVVEAIGSADTTLIKAYHNAYLKRIKRLGIDTSAFTEGFSLPEADFANRDSIDYDQTSSQLKLHIVRKDSSSKLDRFNIWINETPLFSTRGYSLRSRNTSHLDTTLSIILSDGINNIETSVTDVNGIESYRIPLPVNYTPQKKATEKIYFIGIGIDKFKDSSHNLTWSVNDIKNFADSLKSKCEGNITIHTLFNQDVTVDNVKALKQVLYKTTINDKVIVAYSGHGLLSDSFDYYLSTYNVNFEKPKDGGLSYDIMEDLLDNIPARKKLMLLDACHSGEVDKEEMAHYKQVQAKLDSNKISRGTVLENTDSSRLGMKNTFELMQELFVNVGRSTGATIISAAAGTQFALERNDLKNGVFTYSILEYMKDHTSCTVTELKRYVNKRVSDLTEGLQQPTARTENINYDWTVW